MPAKKKITLDSLLDVDKADRVVDELSFEEGLHLLEELVEKVESGSLELDKAVTSYERGALVVKRLRGLLSGAEEKLRTLQKDK